MKPPKRATTWKWIEGRVDTHDDYLQLSYGDSSIPVALVAPGKPEQFVVQFLLSADSNHDDADKILQAVRRELDFYLVKKGESDPWVYAKYHCTTAANVYSDVHWGYFPGGHADKSKERPGEGKQQSLFDGD